MPVTDLEHVIKNIGVLLVGFLVTGGLYFMFAPASVMPVANSIISAIVLAVLLALVIAFFIKIPILGTGIGALLGSIVSFYFLSLLAPVEFTFGIGFALVAFIISAIVDWLATSLMK